MARLRWISKPFKGWAFAKGKYFTNLYAWRYQRQSFDARGHGSLHQ